MGVWRLDEGAKQWRAEILALIAMLYYYHGWRWIIVLYLVQLCVVVWLCDFVCLDGVVSVCCVLLGKYIVTNNGTK